MKAEMLYTVIINKKKQVITATFYNREDAQLFINAQDDIDTMYASTLSIKKQRIIWTIAENTRG